MASATEEVALESRKELNVPPKKRQRKTSPSPEQKEENLKRYNSFLESNFCCECNKNGLEACLGMVYRCDDDSIVCTNCEDNTMYDGTRYSDWKIEGLDELYDCGYFRYN
jgi:hypothetical protein